jgi:hypothetical protein
MPLVEQELPTLPEHLSSPTVFSGVRMLGYQNYRPMKNPKFETLTFEVQK